MVEELTDSKNAAAEHDEPVSAGDTPQATTTDVAATSVVLSAAAEPASSVHEASSDRRGKHASDDKVPATGSRYVPALDGLRSFAVIAVILYHMGLGWAPGGLMGVTVFFVISGYLINGLLVAEHERTGRISLKGFWMRRVRRLFPAIALAVVGTAALCTLFNHVLLDKMRPDVLPSLLFYNNWWQIFRDISYFEAAGSPSPLMHFWSLSIEEQFYVVWPLLLLLMYRLGLGKRGMARVVLILAVLSAVEMALLYDPFGDPSRVYYGTDTRAMSLLLGVWLAFVWPSAAFGSPAEGKHGVRGSSHKVLYDIVGIAAFAGLVAIVALTNGYSSFSYYGGIAAVSVLSALLIAALVVPETLVARFFALRPLVWIGKRSYGMYLWHFPILLLTTDPNSTTGLPWWMRVVQVALIVAVSALSYAFVEDPIRKGKVGAWWKARREQRALAAGSDRTHVPSAPLSARLRVAVPALCFAGLLGVACVGLFAVEETDYAAQLAGAAGEGRRSSDSVGVSASAGVAEDGVGAGEGAHESASEDGVLINVMDAVREKRTMDDIRNVPVLNAAGEYRYEPLLIGDSVSLGAIDRFYEVFPYGCLDSVVSRNIWESTYGDYLAEDRVGDYVVFCLGTNNAVSAEDVDELLAPVAQDKHVVLVNTRNVRDWMEGTNYELGRAPERHANVTVIDWFGASEGHDEYFAGDGTHLTPEGADAYVQLIYNAIESTL